MHARIGLKGLAAGLLALSALGCDTELTAGRSLPTLESCVSTKAVVAEPRRHPGPASLRLHQGQLYYTAAEHFEALPLAAGPPTVLAPETGTVLDLWVDGDRLIYLRAPDQLWTLPLTGGATAAILPEATEPAAYPWTTATAFDGAYVYWIMNEVEIGPPWLWNVWRRPIAGGPADKVGAISGTSAAFDRLSVAGDDLLIASRSDAHAFALGRQGGQPRPLAPGANDTMIGHDDQGVLWWRSRPGGTREREVVRSPLGGGPLEVVTAIAPQSFLPTRAWKIDDHTWLFAGLEEFAGQHFASSLFTYEARGTWKRLDCDTRGDGEGSLVETEPVVTENGIYVMTTDLLARPVPTWSIVRVPR